MGTQGRTELEVSPLSALWVVRPLIEKNVLVQSVSWIFQVHKLSMEVRYSVLRAYV